MKSVYVFNRVDKIYNLFIVKMLWQRKLTENSVYAFIVIKLNNQLVKLFLSCFLGKGIFSAVKAAFLAGSFLIADVNL